MIYLSQEFDWIPYSQRDIDHILEGLKNFNSVIFSDDLVRKIRKTITPLIKEHFSHFIEKDVTNRITPEIFPPGKVIHLYRDGVGISGCYVSNNFFNEIDVNRRMAEGKFRSEQGFAVRSYSKLQLTQMFFCEDHLIFSGYEQTFLEIMRQNMRDHHFRFEPHLDASNN